MKWQLAAIFLVMMQAAYAQGIGVSPARLEFSGRQGAIVERQFIIYNPSAEEMHFSIDGPFLFSEKSGRIEASGNRKVTASTQLKEAGSAKITIVAESGSEGLSLNAGVAIDAIISVLQEAKDMAKVIGPMISASIVVAGLGIFGAVGGFRRSSQRI
jgi:hypothetical protein